MMTPRWMLEKVRGSERTGKEAVQQSQYRWAGEDSPAQAVSVCGYHSTSDRRCGKHEAPIVCS